MSTRSMHAALDPLLGQLYCEGCQKAFQDRINDLFVQWTAVAVGVNISFLEETYMFPNSISMGFQVGWGIF